MIRAATAQDIPALVALGARMHAESPRFRRLKFSPEKLTQTLNAVMVNPLGLLWVAEVDGEVVGVAMGIAFEHWCSTDLVATDMAIFVDEQHRGGILAARLVRRFITWMDDTGAVLKTAGVSTGVHADQTALLYERLGMRRFGVLLEL